MYLSAMFFVFVYYQGDGETGSLPDLYCLIYKQPEIYIAGGVGTNALFRLVVLKLGSQR
jgi:hypothetical protein